MSNLSFKLELLFWFSNCDSLVRNKTKASSPTEPDRRLKIRSCMVFVWCIRLLSLMQPTLWLAMIWQAPHLERSDQHIGYSAAKRWDQNYFPLDENCSKELFSMQDFLGFWFLYLHTVEYHNVFHQGRSSTLLSVCTALI